jgi:hypothetical protein
VVRFRISMSLDGYVAVNLGAGETLFKGVGELR